MNGWKWSVLGASFLLLTSWISANFERLTGDQHGGVRFFLGTLFALLILLRPKPRRPAAAPVPARSARVTYVAGILGALLAVGGLVFRVLQVEWVGIVLLLFACWRWALPGPYAGDILRALFLLYWVHPLPSLVFANLQFVSQKWSVAWAEWLLHAQNVRVWADGFFLYSGFNVIGVPESCSGMRTALTVLLCALGIGILFRFRWWELALLTVIGLLQVILLNAIRIAAVVVWAPRMPREWSDNFLHDTLGSFLMVAIVLTQVEASLWQWARARRRRVRLGIASEELERPQRATRLPRFWQLMFRWGRVLLVFALLSLVTVAVAYKSRPAHREVMRREVIDGLLETDLDAAERAIAQHLAIKPKDRDLISRQARIQVMRRDFEGALATFETLAPPLDALETTLMSWALMAVGRVEDAVTRIDALPASARRLPGVAIVRAEFAAIQGQPTVVSEYVVHAGGGIIDPNRVRALFPFLARHEQWAAIVRADSDRPYLAPSHALIAVYACWRVNNVDAAARVLRQALRAWPNDPRFLRDLYTMAARRPGGEWETRFAENFRSNYDDLNAEQLVPYLGYCFQLARPDLAWLAYLRLLALDARHPDVFFAPAQFGDKWFLVRRHHIGVGGVDRAATIDLRPLAAHTRHLWPLARLWPRIPLARELGSPTVGVVRDRYMKWTLAELESRETQGNISMRGELIFPSVLAAEGRFEEAHRRLEDIRRKYPVFTAQVQLQHAEIYDQEKNWEQSYEALREYYAITDLIELQADLLMVNALLNLNMGVRALDVAQRAAKTFPGVAYIDLMRAAIWDIFGFKEQALFTLGNHEDDIFLYTAARLNADTGRWREAERVHGALGMPFNRRVLQGRQPLLPPPAELAIARRWPAAGAEERARDMARAASLALESTSPFVRQIESLVAAWHQDPAAPGAADPERWRAAGRDPAEEATALHRLGVLLARAGRYEEAEIAIAGALERMPDSAILHRVRIALTEGNPEVVQAARRACPDDPEIWLAWLVIQFRDQGPGAWALEAVRAAVAGKPAVYAPGDQVRAADFLLRAGMLEAATLLARQVQPRAQGLISGIMLGLRCALQAREVNWALECARQGIEHAIDPAVFYQAVVRIKTIQETPDADLVQALEYLKEQFPRETEWAQYLGQVYFQKGDTSRALTILEPLIAAEMSGVRVRSLLLAAEAARVSGYETKAITILERALALHPEQVSVLNNLVYNLALRPETVGRAMQMLPRLLEMGGDSFAVLDTAAMAYLRSGQIDLARTYMDRAMALLRPEDYSALETRLNAAEIMLEQGEWDIATRRIREVRQDPRVSTFLDARARRLQDEIQRRRTNP